VVRDHQWQLAWAAVKRGTGRPGEDDWSWLRAVDAAGRQSWDEALWFLDRLVAHNPADWAVLADRAEVHGRRGDTARHDADLRAAVQVGGGQDRNFAVQWADQWAREERWPEVAGLLTEAVKAHPADVYLSLRLAPALLKAGDREGHAALCQSLLRNLPAKPSRHKVVTVSELWALSDRALPDWSRPVELVGDALRAVKAAEQSETDERLKKSLRELRRGWLTAQAGVLHRAGRHRDAIACCEEAMRLSPDGQGGPAEWIWLALAHAAADKPKREVARGWLRKVRAAVPKRGEGAELWTAVALEILVAEAARTIDEN
jgi:tetratricopeptide (TPR) repeat protein